VKIVVLVKEVPDTYGDRKLSLETGLVDRAASDRVNDEIGERAVEAALTIQDAISESTVTVITMGGSTAAATVRNTLAMGADEAFHVFDDGLLGADLTLTAEVLSAVIAQQAPDLVIAGDASTDGGGGVLAAMLAEHLGWAQATNLSSLEIDGTTVRGTRVADGGTAVIEATLPAVVSITEAMPDPRMPGFKGVIAAKKKLITPIDAAEVAADLVGAHAARAIVVAASERPPRMTGVKIIDEGDGGRRLAEFLIEQKLA
jgi:electron transfer flavoprotein beta subunit